MAVHHARDAAGTLTVTRSEGAAAVTAWHSHASLILGRMVAGRRTLRLVGGNRVLDAGDGFVVSPGSAHAWSAGEASVVVLAVAADRRDVPRCGTSAIRDAAWRSAFDAAVVAVEAGDADAPAAVAALLEKTARIAPPEPVARILAGAVRKARRLAGERLDEPLPLSALGREVGLSPWHLHRLYRAQWGLAPAEHRLEERLRLARRLLLDGASVAQAAATTGFADQSHLCRAFRRLMGVPPGVWLRQIRRGCARG